MQNTNDNWKNLFQNRRNIMTNITQALIDRVEYHQKMERLARVYKNGTVSYHKTKSEAFQEALAMLEPKENNE
jgi:hypothetical protein